MAWLLQGTVHVYGKVAGTTVGVAGHVAGGTASAALGAAGAVAGGVVGLVDQTAGREVNKFACGIGQDTHGAATYAFDTANSHVQRMTDMTGSFDPNSYGNGDVMIFMCQEHYIFVLETEEGYHRWDYLNNGMNQETFRSWKEMKSSREGRWIMVDGRRWRDGRRGREYSFRRVKAEADWLRRHGFGDDDYRLCSNNCHRFVNQLLERIG